MDSNRQASNWALTKSWSRSCLLLLYASTGRASLLTCQPAWQSLLQTTAPSQVPLIVHQISEFLFVSRTVFSVDCSSSSSPVVQHVESCSEEPSQQLDMWCHPSDLVSLMSPAYPQTQHLSIKQLKCFAPNGHNWISCKNFPHSLVTQWVLQVYFSTFTMCFAATSGCCKPRQQTAAFSELKASHTPSEAMMSLPPAFESCQKKRRKRHCEQSQVLSSHSWYLHSRYYTKSACVVWHCSCSLQDHKVQLSSPNTLHLHDIAHGH